MAFIIPVGHYNWKRLSLGVASAPGAFENLKELVFSGLAYEVALVYLDDINVFGRTLEGNLLRLKKVFARLK